MNLKVLSWVLFGESDILKQSMLQSRLHSGKQRHLWGSLSTVDWSMTALFTLDDQDATLHLSNLWSLYITNIARIAKGTLHKLPGKSSLNVRSVCPSIPIWLVCPICPVCHVCPGCPVRPVCPDDHVNHSVYPAGPVWQPVVFPSRLSCKMSPQMTCLKSLNGRSCKEAGGCTQASRRLSDLI